MVHPAFNDLLKVVNMPENIPPNLPTLNPATPADPAPESDLLDKFLLRLFVLLMAMTLFWFLFWVGGYGRQSEVVSSRTIGHFIRMSGPGGWQDKVVIETDTGSYPLLQAPAIPRGTPLLLELRGSGQRFVCDLPRTLCIKTASDEFKTSGEPSDGNQP